MSDKKQDDQKQAKKEETELKKSNDPKEQKKSEDGKNSKEKSAEVKEAKSENSAKQDPKDAKIADLTNTLQRLQAEFENYKKRCDREIDENRKFATKNLIVKLLPILDSFELALKNKTHDNQFIKGVELLFAQLYSVLEAEGISKIDSLGKKFDPMRHEVLITGESDKEEDMVLEELQKGYLLKGALLRTSKVKISKKK